MVCGDTFICVPVLDVDMVKSKLAADLSAPQLFLVRLVMIVIDSSFFYINIKHKHQMATPPPVILRKLGRVSYSKALALQQTLANKYKTVQSSQVRT